jgi:hypothetical protein
MTVSGVAGCSGRRRRVTRHRSAMEHTRQGSTWAGEGCGGSCKARSMTAGNGGARRPCLAQARRASRAARMSSEGASGAAQILPIASRRQGHAAAQPSHGGGVASAWKPRPDARRPSRQNVEHVAGAVQPDFGSDFSIFQRDSEQTPYTKDPHLYLVYQLD